MLHDYDLLIGTFLNITSDCLGLVNLYAIQMIWQETSLNASNTELDNIHLSNDNCI